MEPFGEERADLRAGVVAAVIANVNRDPRRSSREYRPGDFVLHFGVQEDDSQRSGRWENHTKEEFDDFKALCKAIAGGSVVVRK